jgi:heptosyltransferase-2
VSESAGGGAPLLVIRFGSLGDVVLTFAAGAALKEARPQRPIHYLVKAEYADLVRAQPWVDEVLALEGSERDFAGARAWRERLRVGAWSGVLDLQDDARSRFLTRGIAARTVRWERKGLARRWWVWSRPLRALGYRPPWVPFASQRYLDAAMSFGLENAGRPSVVVPPEADARVSHWWRERWGEREVIALLPAAAWATKEWPEAYNRTLLQMLVREGYGICVISTETERVRLSGLAADVAAEPAAGWWVGTLPEVAAALSYAQVVVGPDSGLIHLAAAVDRRVVVLFGSTVPALGFLPLSPVAAVIEAHGLRCRPCDVHGKRRCPLGHHKCMRDSSPEEVLHAIRRVREGPR